MEKSESVKELAIALNKVQANLQAAKKGNVNPYFHSKYADLLSIWEACREVLTENGLSIVQVGDLDDQGNAYLETILLHSSGEWIKGRLPLHAIKADPQGQGSAITYARRYSLSSMIGLCTEVDDDAEVAMGRKKQETKPQPNPQTKPIGMISEAQMKVINTLLTTTGNAGDFERHEQVAKILGLEATPTSLRNLTSTQASTVIETLKEPEGEPVKSETTRERDPKTLQGLGDLYNACSEDFNKMTRKEVWVKLGVNDQSEIIETPAECYRIIKATMRGE